MNTQLIRSCDTTIVQSPSGRDIRSTKLYVPPVPDEETIACMRATADIDEAAEIVDNSDSNDEEAHGRTSDLPGSFLGRCIGASGEESYY